MIDEPVLWKALAEHLRERIRTGALKPGDQLPAYRAWDKLDDYRRAKVATARTAVEVLVAEGWLTSIPGKGLFVVGVPSVTRQLTLEERVDRIERHLGIDQT